MPPEDVVSAVLAEAERLGLVVRGALTPLGDALATGGPAALSDLAEQMWQVTTTATIQADHTVIATGLTAPDLTALLDSCADLESSDPHARIWRLSPASVRRHLDTGATADDLLTALLAIAPAGIPQVVRYLISDAGRRHGGDVRVSAGVCVETADEATAEQILTDPMLARLHPRRVGSCALLCAGDLNTVLAQLRSAGYAPIAQTIQGSPLLSAQRSARPSPSGGGAPDTAGQATPAGTPSVSRSAASPLDQLAILIDDSDGEEALQGTAAELSAAAPILSAGDCRTLASAITDRSAIVIEYSAAYGTVTATVRRPGLERRYGAMRLISLRTNGQPDHKTDVALNQVERVLPHSPKTSRARRTSS
ncbi:helicase-associated domain-containing protein [Nonomuraea sp. NPDC052129]|uniref:helicase-associated domain-containing protein n=1 Tax=Nonomuraea sp. NPDC052129 TaxID=3154651 RepID=UPI003441E6B8